MTIVHKSYPCAHFKQVEGAEGVFEAIVSVFNNVDLIGDRVRPGAFTKSLEEWRDSGDPIPVIFSHQWDNLDAHVGAVVEAEERDEGLFVKGQLDLEEEYAAKLWRKLSQRRIKEFSFAFEVRREKRAGDGANDLLELGLIEVGPTLKGMNPDTQLIGTRRLDEKLGRVLSAKNEQSLKEAHQLIGGVLEQLQRDEDKSQAKTDDPETGKADEPATTIQPRDIQLLGEAALHYTPGKDNGE